MKQIRRTVRTPIQWTIWVCVVGFYATTWAQEYPWVCFEFRINASTSAQMRMAGFLRGEFVRELEDYGITPVTGTAEGGNRDRFIEVNGVRHYFDGKIEFTEAGVAFSFWVAPTKLTTNDGPRFKETLIVSGKNLQEDLAIIRSWVNANLPDIRFLLENYDATRILAYCIYEDSRSGAGIGMKITTEYGANLGKRVADSHKVRALSAEECASLCEVRADQSRVQRFVYQRRVIGVLRTDHVVDIFWDGDYHEVKLRGRPEWKDVAEEVAKKIGELLGTL